MPILLVALLSALRSILRSRAGLQLENFALRHQIGVLRRSVRNRPKLRCGDRFLWVSLSRIWHDWRSALVIVKPEGRTRFCSDKCLTQYKREQERAHYGHRHHYSCTDCVTNCTSVVGESKHPISTRLSHVGQQRFQKRN